MKIEKLPTCECGVPTDSGEDVYSCGKGAVAIVSWTDKDAIYMCEEHLEQAQKDEET